MTEIKKPIPARLYNASQGGHVCGAEDIIDDALNLEQSVINEIVATNVVTTSVSVSSSVATAGSQGNVTLTASSAITMDSITIKKGDDTIGSSTNSGTATGTDSAVNTAGTTDYVANFVKGGLTKTVNRKVGAIYFGSGANVDAGKTNFIIKTSPAGTYSITVGTAGTYVWFYVPDGIANIQGATKSGFTYPISRVADTTIDGVTYKVWRSDNTYDPGTEVVVLR